MRMDYVRATRTVAVPAGARVRLTREQARRRAGVLGPGDPADRVTLAGPTTFKAGEVFAILTDDVPKVERDGLDRSPTKREFDAHDRATVRAAFVSREDDDATDATGAPDEEAAAAADGEDGDGAAAADLLAPGDTDAAAKVPRA